MRILLVALCVLVGSVHAAPRSITPRGPLTAEEKNNVSVFENSKASVVYISTSEHVLDYWTLKVKTVPHGTGSGFIWDSAGHVVTNLHVIADAAEATVRLADGKDYPATLVGVSRTHDIAVLQIRIPSAAVPIPIGTSHDLQVGQKVYAIGNPFGLDWTLTTGIVSALDRSLTGENGVLNQHLVQTDAAINPGNSGGPLLDSAGRLIGMNTAIYSPSGASAGVGFAVPVDTDQPGRTRDHHQGPLLLAEPRDPDRRESEPRNCATTRGRRALSYCASARADPPSRAGLRGARFGRRNAVYPGDVIVALNGKPMDSVGRLFALLDDCKPGEVVQLTVWRDGKKMRVPVTLRSGEDDNYLCHT